MHENSLRACLALHRNASLSNRNRCQLLSAVERPEQLFQLSSVELKALGLSAASADGLYQKPDEQILEKDLASLRALDISVLPINSPAYPSLLKEIHNPPAMLYVRGKESVLETPQLAIVGSRRTSKAGSANAFSFARTFASAGCTVTSGMALGIDAESHRGALVGEGKTVAVLGTGVDVIYPRRNAALYHEIIQRGGAVISELPLGTVPRPSQFPSRNRLISGLSLGVLVVEAALKSGSLITARLAMEQGREVFAVPGSIHNPASKGCHALIREGGKLVETAEHILEEFSGWTQSRVTEEQSNNVALDPKEKALLEQMGYERQTLDMLQQQCGWAVAELMATLTELEMKGVIENNSGCYQRIKC
jgi:DNA processing protein